MDDILQTTFLHNFLNENIDMSIQISTKFVLLLLYHN